MRKTVRISSRIYVERIIKGISPLKNPYKKFDRNSGAFSTTYSTRNSGLICANDSTPRKGKDEGEGQGKGSLSLYIYVYGRHIDHHIYIYICLSVVSTCISQYGYPIFCFGIALAPMSLKTRRVFVGGLRGASTAHFPTSKF